METEKIYSLDPIINKLIVDNLSLFRDCNFYVADKVLAGTRFYLKEHSQLKFEQAAAQIQAASKKKS